MDRRKFLQQSALLTASGILSLHSLKALPFEVKNAGIQLFSIPKMLDEDFLSGIQMLSEMGYKEIELFGPYPFSAESAKASWAAAGRMLGFDGSGYFGLEAARVNEIMNEYGMTVPSAHTDLDTLEKRMPQLAEAAEILGFTYVCLPAIPESERKNLDQYKRMADRFNAIGEEANSYGLKFAYHNHGYGLQKLEGEIPLELIFDRTDADKVFFEMDIFWTAGGGVDPIHYLKKYPGRYKLLHIKDMTEAVTFAGDGSTPDQWFALFPYMTSAGEGVMDLEGIIAEAEKGGVDHFLIEQDMVAEPQIALKKSIDYMSGL